MSARILVVEDEIIVARKIASQLTQLGYTVVDTASSGEMAIAKANQHQPNLILMDIVLKGEMDGVTAASQICTQFDIPIIFLTAYADEATLKRAKNTLPLGYIVKPFSAGELRVAIELALFKHQTEQELRSNRQYLATILQSMNDAVIATDEQGQITFMNPAAEKLTGWREHEALGKAAHEVVQLIDEVTNLAIEHPVAKVLQTREVGYLKDFTALVNRNGDRISIGDSASPLQQLNNVRGVVMVFWDTSVYRQSELMKKALEKEQEINQIKSQFISTISHELQNPLAIIRTATELLNLQEQQLEETKITSYLERIKIAVERMNGLIEDVLLMSRIEAGRLQYMPTLLDLHQFFQDLLEECSFNLNPAFHLIFTHPEQSPEVRMDSNLLYLIFSNLINNSIKYSPEGGAIELNLSYDSDEKIAIVRLQDQGIGIPESDQSQLFESFFRASNVNKIKGTGMGLVIVKRCVEVHQGQIHLTSQVGVGTTVTVTLPLTPLTDTNNSA